MNYSINKYIDSQKLSDMISGLEKLDRAKYKNEIQSLKDLLQAKNEAKLDSDEKRFIGGSLALGLILLITTFSLVAGLPFLFVAAFLAVPYFCRQISFLFFQKDLNLSLPKDPDTLIDLVQPKKNRKNTSDPAPKSQNDRSSENLKQMGSSIRDNIPAHAGEEINDYGDGNGVSSLIKR